MRCCCMPRARPFESVITLNGVSYQAVKDYKCSACCSTSLCFCLKSPDMVVRKGTNVIGYVTLKKCGESCEGGIEAYYGKSTSRSKLMFEIRTCMSSEHTMAGVSCGKCYEGAKYHYFGVYDNKGKTTGCLRKVHSGFCQECCTAADQY